MDKKPVILITNDDGIEAAGLRHLWQAVADFAEVYVVAPAQEQSGVGVAITLRNPIHVEQVKWERNTPAWKVNGTPADCVKMALRKLLPNVPDLIISGINRGSNSGKNVFYSGTIGGVIEGVLRNIPGIAFSCEDFLFSNFHLTEKMTPPKYHLAEKYIASIVRHVLEEPLPKGTFLNVNFPKKMEEIKGFKLTRQGRGYWIENPDERTHPDGKTYYWLGGAWNDQTEHDESDVRFLAEGYMTAVPIHIEELTHHTVIEERKDAFEQLFHEKDTFISLDK